MSKTSNYLNDEMLRFNFHWNNRGKGRSRMERAQMKILIVDDHILFAEGMRFLLNSYKEDIDTLYAENFESALKVISKEGQPDLILLDINLAGTNGLTLIKEFQNLNIWAPILIVSATDSPSAAMIAVQKGASGFVSKASESAILLSAIKTVLEGECYPSQESGSVVNTTEDESVATITARQHEILYLLSQGMLNKQIAYELSISANTVKAHLHQIFRELNVHNRTAAVQSAHKCGWL
jgi:DNA-binding NarL/FixJ family response regulator